MDTATKITISHLKNITGVALHALSALNSFNQYLLLVRIKSIKAHFEITQQIFTYLLSILASLYDDSDAQINAPNANSSMYHAAFPTIVY